MSLDFEDFSTNYCILPKLDMSFHFEYDPEEYNKFELDLNNTFTQPNRSDLDDLSNDNNIQQNNNILPENNSNINKQLLGRKKKNSGEIGKHGKNAEDNMIRKVKVLLKDNILKFINKKIKDDLKLSEIIINDKKYEKENIKLLNIKQKQIVDTTVNGNQKLLKTKIRDIFSDEISTIYTSQPSNFNALLIEKIYQIDFEKKVTSILDKTFLECLQFFRKDEDIINEDYYNCLEGLQKGFDELKDKLKKKNNDEEYVDDLIRLIKEFEKIYYNKKARAKRKKKNEDLN